MQITLNLSPEIINAIADAVVAKLTLPNNVAGSVSSKWLTHAEAAEYIRKTPAGLYKLTSQRQLKFTKRGKQNLYLKEHLDSYLMTGQVMTVDEITQNLLITKNK